MGFQDLVSFLHSTSQKVAEDSQSQFAGFSQDPWDWFTKLHEWVVFFGGTLVGKHTMYGFYGLENSWRKAAKAEKAQVLFFNGFLLEIKVT